MAWLLQSLVPEVVPDTRKVKTPIKFLLALTPHLLQVAMEEATVEVHLPRTMALRHADHLQKVLLIAQDLGEVLQVEVVVEVEVEVEAAVVEEAAAQDHLPLLPVPFPVHQLTQMK